MQTIALLRLWANFGGIVRVSLFIGFVVLNKQGEHDIGVKEALNWSMAWIALNFFSTPSWCAVNDRTGTRRPAGF